MQRPIRKRKVEVTNSFVNENRKQPMDQARPKALKTIIAGSAAAGVLVVSAKWSKPVVNSIILPAHAQATNVEGPATETTTTVVPTTTIRPFEEGGSEGGSVTSWGGAVFTAQAPVTAPTAEVAPLSRRVSVGKSKK